MEHPRTTSAREHDDHDIIDAAAEAPSFAGSSGGKLQLDVASQDELTQTEEPGAHTRVSKQDTADHGMSQRRERGRAPDSGT